MQAADTRNDKALNPKAIAKPDFTTTAPRKAPTVRLAHDVVWVIVPAVWSSSAVAMLGNTAARPPEKKGDANINTALSPKSSQFDL